MLRSGPQKNEDVLQVEAAARPDQTPMELCKRGRRDIADWQLSLAVLTVSGAHLFAPRLRPRRKQTSRRRGPMGG